MLEWGSPLWFLALPLALAAPWIGRNPRLAWSSLALTRSVHTWRTLLAPLPKLLTMAGLVALVVALARPQRVDREQFLESEGIDIMLAIDTSGSMQQADYTLSGRRASRLEVAKEVAARFVEGRPNDRVGLVVFGEEAFTQVPLTMDHDSMVEFLQQVELGMAGERATAVGDALAVAGKRLKELQAPSKVVVLVTDGRSNAGNLSPIQAAQAAAALGIRVYTIGVGGDGRAGPLGLFGGRSDLDERSLRAIADTTGGRYFRAANTSALEEVYATIDKLEKSTAKVRELVHREERYQPFLVAGLSLLLLGGILGETILRRLP